MEQLTERKKQWFICKGMWGTWGDTDADACLRLVSANKQENQNADFNQFPFAVPRRQSLGYSQHTMLCFEKYSTLRFQSHVEMDCKFVVAAAAVDIQAARIAAAAAAAVAADKDSGIETQTHPDPSTTDCNWTGLDIDNFAAVSAGFDRNQPATDTSRLIEFWVGSIWEVVKIVWRGNFWSWEIQRNHNSELRWKKSDTYSLASV